MTNRITVVGINEEATVLLIIGHQLDPKEHDLEKICPEGCALIEVSVEAFEKALTRVKQMRLNA